MAKRQPARRPLGPRKMRRMLGDDTPRLAGLFRKRVPQMNAESCADGGTRCAQVLRGRRDALRAKPPQRLELICRVSCYYQPITATLYTSRTGMVISVI